MRRKKPDVQRLIDLHDMVLQFRAVERLVYIPGQGDVAENDIDHSYTLALAAWYLTPHFPELDAHKVLRLALSHDLVEIHSGDTDPFNTKRVATKDSRESAARAQLKRDWPDFPALHASLQEYVDRQTPEAKFVYALDKLLPITLNYLGQGYGWRKLKITIEKLDKIKKDRVREHPGVAKYYKALYKLLLDRPEWFHQPKGPSQQR